MTATIISATPSTGAGTAYSAGNDGTLTIQTGATAGAQVNAISLAADGTMTLLKPLAGGSLTLGTAQNTTSGTSIDFTGIPSWAKRITVMLNGVSTNGTSPVRLQIGGGSVETTGYASKAEISGIGNATSTGGFDFYQTAAADVVIGKYVLDNMGSNQWICTCQYARYVGTNHGVISGSKTTAAALDRIRLTTVGGTDTFDAGSVNILYEG